MNDIFLVPTLKKDLLSISYVIDVECTDSFEGHECTISYCDLAIPRTLARGVSDGVLYMMLANIMSLLHVQCEDR